MDMDLVKRGSPLEWELARRRTELARLERELAEREQALADYKSALATFQRRYVEALARPYAELDELEAQAAEKASQLRPDDATKRRKAERLRARADQSAGIGQPRPEPAQSPAPKPQPVDDTRKLYRELTKLAHPDLTTDPDERRRREAVMIQANAAYAEGDAGLLAYLLGNWEMQDEDAGSSDVESTLERIMEQIALITERLDGPTKEREALESSDLGGLMRRADLAERQGRDLFVRLVEEVEEVKRHARKRIKTLDRRLAKGAQGGDADED